MNKEEIFNYCLENLKSSEIKKDEPMKKHTSFKIGGNADIFIKISDLDDLKNILKFINENKINFTIVGNGSNILVKDNGIRGIVVKLDFKEIDIKKDDNKAIVTVGAGVSLGLLAQKLLKESIGGFEFASGIPGTIGGAVRMNAGAYGGEMKDVLKEVTVLTPEGGVLTLQADELHMGYRTSVIKEAGYIVLEAVISLEKGDQEEIRSRMQELAGMRTSKQPLSYPSAGSTFKRPEGYFAGKLIMDSGLRGYQVGGAQVSEKHCGFVINTGNATAKDVTTLMSDVQRIVMEKFGVKLEQR